MLKFVRTRGMRAFAAVAAVAALSMPALADLIGDGFLIIAQDDASGTWGSAAFQATQDPDGTWRWSSNAPVDLRSGDGTVLGTLNPAGSGGSSIEYVEDPIVNLNFSVAAGSSTTTFMIGSAMMTFPTISGAIGRSSVAFSVSDGIGGGAVLTGIGGNSAGSGYTAAVNGMAGPLPPGPNQFAEMIPGISAPAGGSNSVNDAFPLVGYNPIGVPVSSISSFVAFTLSPFDLASGTSTFEVIPEPASLALLVLGAGMLRRRS